MPDLLDSITFQSGTTVPNRFFFAPLTNWQSHPDGTISSEELHWLELRAKGGFGLTMTCAAHVQAIGQGFPGQLGVYSDFHLPGLTKLAKTIQKYNSRAIAQLHHAGMRSPKELIQNTPVCPSDNERAGARALSTDDTYVIRDSFIQAAIRCEKAGFDGIELHGAHGYLLCQYFSESINHRTDQYGGSVENRYRILFEIIDGIRSKCSSNFGIGVRLSPERFGMKLNEAIHIAEILMNSTKIDFLDMSLWDCFKMPADENYQDKSLLQYFADIPRSKTLLGAAGNIRTPAQAEQVLKQGLDYVFLGRAAIIHHNFPLLYQNNKTFSPYPLPLTRAYLNNEGLSDVFVDYVKSNWPEFVDE